MLCKSLSGSIAEPVKQAARPYMVKADCLNPSLGGFTLSDENIAILIPDVIGED